MLSPFFALIAIQVATFNLHHNNFFLELEIIKQLKFAHKLQLQLEVHCVLGLGSLLQVKKAKTFLGESSIAILSTFVDYKICYNYKRLQSSSFEYNYNICCRGTHKEILFLFMFPSHCKLLHNCSSFFFSNFFGDLLCSMHDGTSIASDQVQLQLFFSIGVPNAFDVALLTQVNLVVVYSASCCSTIEGDGQLMQRLLLMIYVLQMCY